MQFILSYEVIEHSPNVLTFGARDDGFLVLPKTARRLESGVFARLFKASMRAGRLRILPLAPSGFREEFERNNPTLTFVPFLTAILHFRGMHQGDRFVVVTDSENRARECREVGLECFNTEAATEILSGRSVQHLWERANPAQKVEGPQETTAPIRSIPDGEDDIEIAREALGSARAAVRLKKIHFFAGLVVGAILVSALVVVWKYWNWVTETFSSSLVGIGAVIVGALFFWFRTNFQFVYGIIELVVGAVAVGQLSSIDANSVVKALAGLYIIVRGLDNLEKDLKERSDVSRLSSFKKYFTFAFKKRFP
jgi:hypothetical protein